MMDLCLLRRGLFEQCADFVVSRLREILIPDANREKRIGRAGADGFISLRLELRTGLRCPYRHCDNDAARFLAAQRSDRGPHTGTRSQPIIHEDHGLAAYVRRWPIAAV